MEPVPESPLVELQRIKGELHVERGVMFALRELSKGRSLESLFVESIHRIEVLESRKQRLESIRGK